MNRDNHKEKVDIKKLKDILDEIASGEDFITMSDVLCKYLGRELKENENISNFDEYKNLKTLINRELKEADAIEYKNGDTVKNGFRFRADSRYYFRRKEEEKALARRDGDEKKLFLTGGLHMLFGESISNPLIDFECINELTNLKLVKVLYPYIANRRVITFKYNKGYKEIKEVIIHPHLLKEYNSRWFLFGYVKGENETWSIRNFSIDRIVYENKEDIIVHADIKFKNVTENFYKEYFNDIVGVTKKTGKPETFTFRTTNYKVHNLIKSKPIHHSYKEIKPFDELRNEEGEFTITAIPNNELQNKILGYGKGVYIVGNGRFQQLMRDCVNEMYRNYLRGDDETD